MGEHTILIEKGEREILGGRSGTVWASLGELVALLGDPQSVNSADDKVHYRWIFDTPRGPVEVRDYWWNATGEHSIASARGNAALWVARWFRRRGVRAYHRQAGFYAGFDVYTMPRGGH